MELTADIAAAPSSTAAPAVVEENRDAVPKPLSRTPIQIAMAGKPVATVTPMATTKTTSNPNNQSTIPAKPKVSTDNATSNSNNQSTIPAKPKVSADK